MPLLTQNQGKSGRGSYAEPYRHYVERYGVKLRSVKRWVALGKESGEFCPLDDPPAMVGWWTRHMKQRVPVEIMTAAGPESLLEMPVVKTPPVEIPAPPKLDVPVDDLVMPEGLGLEAELGRLETLAARLSIRAHEPGQAKAYLDTVARMGTLSAKLREEAERLKKLLPRDVVESAIHEFHGPIEREMRLMLRTMCDMLGLPVSPETEDAWNKEIDRMFVRFGEEVLQV